MFMAASVWPRSINTLASKLAVQFKEQAEAAERMRERAFRDAVSGLGNRAYFMGQVNAWIAESGRGGIMLVAVDMLDDIYRDEGFAARDSMVKAVATTLQEALRDAETRVMSGATLSRADSCCFRTLKTADAMLASWVFISTRTASKKASPAPVMR